MSFSGRCIAVVAAVVVFGVGSPTVGADVPAIPDFSDTPRAEIPVDVTWDLSQIYSNDEAFEGDLARLGALLAQVDERRPTWTSSADAMLAMYELMTEIMKIGYKAWPYAYLHLQGDLGNPRSQQRFGRVQAMYYQLTLMGSFIEADLVELGAAGFAEYLEAEPGLEPFAHGVNDILRRREHILPADQKRILSLASPVLEGPSTTARLLRDVEIPNPDLSLGDGETVSLTYSRLKQVLRTGSSDDRAAATCAFYRKHETYARTFAALLESSMQAQAFAARARHYPSSLAAHLDEQNLEADVFSAILEAVHANLPVLHRYYELKGRALGLETMRYSDIFVPLVRPGGDLVSRQDAEEIILDTVAFMGPRYTEVLERAFEDRWIDWYANRGKEPIPYQMMVLGVHPYVSLDFDGTWTSVSTLIHELGHAMHSWFSEQSQHPTNAGYTLFLAEMASTFHEHALLDEVLEDESDDERRLEVITAYMDGVRLLVFNQALYGQLEMEMHEQVEAGRTLTAQWLGDRHMELVREFYGHHEGAVLVDECARHRWAMVSQLFDGFYLMVYPIAKTTSLAMYEQVKNGGPVAATRYIDRFLGAGESDDSLEILADLGIDPTDPAVFSDAFDHFNHVLDEMEASIERLEAEGRLPLED